MNKQVRINVRCNAAGKVRKEKLNGRDVLIVPSATLPDGVIMNNIQYPADEIAKSFATLDRTPAPLGHPMVGGKFVSASDPEGINVGWIGAFNTNVRQEGGRVLLDKVIDVERANQSEGGKSVIAAINAGKPIHTSTGLLCNLEAANGDGFKSIARDIFFDHDAILLGAAGAATPDQGVGMMVNSAGEELEVINSSLADEADRELNWAVESLARAMDRQERVSVLERMKAAILDAIGIGREPNLNKLENEMADENQVKELSERVNALSEANDKLGETSANAVTAALKPVLDAQAELTANAKAKDEAELAGHVATIVKANILTEDEAKELTLNVARAMAAKAAPGKAAPLNGAPITANTNDEFADYDLNAGMEVSK